MAQAYDMNAGLLKHTRSKQSKGQSQNCYPKGMQNREQNWAKKRIRVKQMKQRSKPESQYKEQRH